MSNDLIVAEEEGVRKRVIGFVIYKKATGQITCTGFGELEIQELGPGEAILEHNEHINPNMYQVDLNTMELVEITRG